MEQDSVGEVSFDGRVAVARIVQSLINDWDEDAWEINNGNCQMFALALVRRLGSAAKVVSSYDYSEGTFPGHYWVKFQGRHYDAESPLGATHPSDMQYHKRLRAIADSEDDMPEDEAVRQALGHDPIYWPPQRG